jgi:hypothetical protein
VVGRVRIITSLWRRLAMIVPYPLSNQMDKVELGEVPRITLPRTPVNKP